MCEKLSPSHDAIACRSSFVFIFFHMVAEEFLPILLYNVSSVH